MRRMKSDDGQELIRALSIKIFAPGNKTFKRCVVRAEPKRGITPEGIEDILRKVAANLEVEQPDHEYRLVPLGKAAFNFVWQGQVEKSA